MSLFNKKEKEKREKKRDILVRALAVSPLYLIGSVYVPCKIHDRIISGPCVVLIYEVYTYILCVLGRFLDPPRTILGAYNTAVEDTTCLVLSRCR